jgi:hypothetical protein
MPDPRTQEIKIARLGVEAKRIKIKIKTTKCAASECEQRCEAVHASEFGI